MLDPGPEQRKRMVKMFDDSVPLCLSPWAYSIDVLYDPKWPIVSN
jgi:hypothetical protein